MKEKICKGGFGNFTFTSKLSSLPILCLVLVLFTLIGLRPAWGQAPNLVWKFDTYSTVIAVDAQTNLYAQLNSDPRNIVKYNGDGLALQTNLISKVGELSRRDAAGNCYFEGTINSPVDFGRGYVVSNTVSAVAKYDSAGNIVWAYGFGSKGGGQYDSYNVTDLEVDSNGVAYVTWNSVFEEGQMGFSVLQTFSDTTNTVVYFPLGGDNYEIGDLDAQVSFTSATGGFVAAKSELDYNETVHLYALTNKNLTLLTNWSYPYDFFQRGSFVPVGDGLGNVYNTEYLSLTKRDGTGGLIWRTATTNTSLRCVAGDGFGGVQVADDNGLLARYDAAGNLVWSVTYPYRVSALVKDAQGNRFFSRIDGVSARLQPEAMPPTVITNGPAGGTIFAGDNFTFTVGASGFAPFVYTWFLSTNVATPAYAVVPGATGATLTLNSATPAQSGLYYVVLSNGVNVATSTPVELRVKAVEIFAGDQILSGGSYTFNSPTTLNIQSAFANGSVFYTVNGSAPSFTSTAYTGPFVVSSSETIKAIGYSADFTQSALADPVMVTVPGQFNLTVATGGGGVIDGQIVGAPAGSFPQVTTNSSTSLSSNTLITLDAVPTSGFLFLGWQGSVTSTNTQISVRMNQNQSVTAVFGTTLGTTVTGGGQVLLTPPGGVYPYGTVVRVEAVPTAGNSFGAWGNAAAGSSTSPLYFTLTNPAPTISSVFGPTPGGSAALTVLILGKGRVAVNPPGNSFATSASVTLTATPDSGQSFVDWSGSVSSTQNPLVVAMSQPQVITAVFSGQSAALNSGGPGTMGMTPQGFQFTIMGEPHGVYKVQTSTDLNSWHDAVTLTNNTGQMQYVDAGATNRVATYYRVKVMAP